jgi:hypothetical protein
MVSFLQPWGLASLERLSMASFKPLVVGFWLLRQFLLDTPQNPNLIAHRGFRFHVLPDQTGLCHRSMLLLRQMRLLPRALQGV